MPPAVCVTELCKKRQTLDYSKGKIIETGKGHKHTRIRRSVRDPQKQIHANAYTERMNE